MKRFIFFLFLCLVFISGNALADCRATVFADDWSELRTVNDVNDFCSKRATWFRVDTWKYEPKNYCFSSKQTRFDDYGREYYVYPTLFWWKLRDFSGYYQEDVLRDIHYFLRDFSFKGWPSSIKIKFESKC